MGGTVGPPPGYRPPSPLHPPLRGHLRADAVVVGGGLTGSAAALQLAREGLSTLLDYHYQRHYEAGRGEHGKGSGKHGASAPDLTLRVPVGTIVRDHDTREVLGDLSADGQRLLVARGGRGGRGNTHFATATNRAPRRVEPGGSGEARWLHLELKLLADVGVIGFPNAGKSTLVSRVSAARPRIAEYPFTTLTPTLGLVRVDERLSFVIVDLPGLIPGAAEGKGLGHRFLRHTERTRLLIHLIDLDPASGRDPVEDYQVIRDELKAYSPELAARPHLVVANKTDLPGTAARREALTGFCTAAGLPFFAVSAVTEDGLSPLMRAVAERLEAEA